MNPVDHGQLYEAATLILPLIFAIVCHEVAHGWVAWQLGDPTAASRGRLTLNPLKHVDPIGTIIVPGMLALAHAPVFGWAKPVPVDKWRFANPRRGMLIVGAAGPAMNMVLAALAAVGLGLVARFAGTQPVGLAEFTDDNLFQFLRINLSLALFNLLPLPPFDGSHIVEGLLPTALADAYARLRRYGMLLAILLIVLLPRLTGVDLVSRWVDPPFDWIAGVYLRLAAWAAGMPMGVPGQTA